MENTWKSLMSVSSEYLSQIKMIASYTDQDSVKSFSLLLSLKGEVYVVGSGFGTLGLGVSESSYPIKLDGLSGITGISVCGVWGDALAFNKEGQVFVWGKNARPDSRSEPVLFDGLNNVMEAICIQGHYVALTNNGKVYHWRGISIQPVLKDYLSTQPTALEIANEVKSIACGPLHLLALTKNGEIYTWGMKYSGRTVVFEGLSKILLPLETITKVACGTYCSLVLTTSGKLFAWGYYNESMGSCINTPVQVGESIGRCTDIAVNGQYLNAAVTEAGVIYMWGKGANNASLVTPTVTQCTELQQVFARCVSNYSWRCKPSEFVLAESGVAIEEQLQKAFNDEESSDVTLIINNKPLYAHMFMLRLRSDYFRTMLQSYWTDKNKREQTLRIHTLNSYDYEVYKSYVWFLYSGKVVSETEHLLELWDLANAYTDDKFKAGCETLMEQKNLTLSDMALLHSKAMAKMNTLSKVQDDSILKESIERLEKNMQEIQQKQEKIEEDKHKLQEKIEELERNLKKQNEDNFVTHNDELNHNNSWGDIQKSFKKLKTDNKILQENYIKLEKEKEKLKADNAKIRKDYEALRSGFHIEIEEENESNEDCMEEETPDVEQVNNFNEDENSLDNEFQFMKHVDDTLTRENLE